MITLSLFQLVAILVIAFAHISVAYVIGVWQGRLRESCEPLEQPLQDDGETLRALSRGGH